MTKSKVRVLLSIGAILIACGVAWFVMQDSLTDDGSAEALIRKLESFWPSRRRAAATELAQFGGETDQVVPALVKALNDTDMSVRLSAMESLEVFGERSQPAASVVRDTLKRVPEHRIRQRAIALLGTIKDRESVPLLLEALADPQLDIRLEAIRSLGRLGATVSTGPAIDTLISLLARENPDEIRMAAVETLDSLGRDQERVARSIADVAANDPSPAVRNKAVAIIKTPIYDFQVPTLISALDDPSPQVRLAAGSNLAWIGMTDERIVPALCRAALKADSATREGVGNNIDVLILERPADKTPAEQVTRRYMTAANALGNVLETRDAAAREQVINVLGRLIASFQKSGKSDMLEPARVAVRALLGRIEDEQEKPAIRLRAMNQGGMIYQVSDAHSPIGPTSQSGPASPRDQLHYRAMWIAALGRAIKSETPALPFRAMEILADNFKDRGFDPAFRDAWRKIVPALAEAAKSKDKKNANGAVRILGMLGPEAEEALPSLRALQLDATDAGTGTGVEGAIKSISSAVDLTSKDPAVRLAAVERIRRLDWPAARAIPALVAVLKDPDAMVRVAAANAFGALGHLSEPAVQPLAAALASDADPQVRAAIVGALEKIAPGSPAVLDIHLIALRDVDPVVRKAGATFKDTPADDSVVAALATALGDADGAVRQMVAESFATILFSNPVVVPALVKALRNDSERKSVADVLRNHLENVSDGAEFNGVRSNLPALRSTVAAAIPALDQALSLKNDEISPLVYGLLGRILSFARLSRDADLRKAIEPAVQVYLRGLGESTPAIREEVLGRLDAVPIRGEEIVAALQKFLERPDVSDEERQTAVADLESQKTPGGSASARGAARKKKSARGGLSGLVD
jgi:HEAT repeat protein